MSGRKIKDSKIVNYRYSSNNGHICNTDKRWEKRKNQREKSKIQLVKVAQASMCARQRIGTLPRAICELKAQKRYDTKEIVQINLYT